MTSDAAPELAAPAKAPEDDRTYGQIAYDARNAALARAGVRWDHVPWSDLPGELRDGWQASGEAVMADVMTRYGMTAGAPAPAPELAAAMAETRAVRDGYQQLCSEFGPSAQSGWSARVSLTTLNRHRDRAGLPGLPRNAAAGDREDVTMRYRRERDEAREQLAEVRKLAESWAGRAPEVRPIAMQFTMSPHDTVSSDCGRELLACLEADGG